MNKRMRAGLFVTDDDVSLDLFDADGTPRLTLGRSSRCLLA